MKITKAEMTRLSGITEEIKQKTVLILHKVRVASQYQTTSTILSDTFFSYSTFLLTT
jgi:ABC-type enterochelin transport system ATPase subunit